MELIKIPTDEEIKAMRKAEIERLEQERRIEMQKTVLLKIPTKEETKAMEKAKQEMLRRKEEIERQKPLFKIPTKRPKPFKVVKREDRKKWGKLKLLNLENKKNAVYQ